MTTTTIEVYGDLSGLQSEVLTICTNCRDRYLSALEARDDAALADAQDAYRRSDEPRTWSFGGDGGEGAPDQFVRLPDLQALAEEGDWGEMDPADGSIAVTVYATCEETGERLSELCVIDPEEPECPLGEHEWSEDHDLVGGCKSNPGVWGHGAGISSDSVCTLCGIKRTHYTCTQGTGAETEYDHDGVRYGAGAVDAAGLARHHDGAAPRAALDAYDDVSEATALVDACVAYRLEHGESLSDLVEDADLPPAAVAAAIRRAGAAAIETEDGTPERLGGDDSDAMWVTSTHRLVVGGATIATWCRCACGSWGARGARADKWVVHEDTDGGELPSRVEDILIEMGMDDDYPSVPEPEQEAV